MLLKTQSWLVAKAVDSSALVPMVRKSFVLSLVKTQASWGGASTKSKVASGERRMFKAKIMAELPALAEAANTALT